MVLWCDADFRGNWKANVDLLDRSTANQGKVCRLRCINLNRSRFHRFDQRSENLHGWCALQSFEDKSGAITIAT